MQVEIIETHLNGVVIVKNEFFSDERGFFTEVFRADQYRALGLPDRYVQQNHSGSVKNVVRGIHFQWDPPMGKLMRVVSGEAFLIAADLRKDSPSFGEWFGDVFSSKEPRLIWAPAGFGRGFCALSDWVELEYLCTGVYNQDCEGEILWDDPDIGIKWPMPDPILSDRDLNAQRLSDWVKNPESNHPTFSLVGR